MTKLAKEMVLQNIKQLEDALNVLEAASSLKLTEDGIRLLAAMQQTAIEIGNRIESVEGSHPVIAELEKLCEVYYQCSLRIDSGKSIEQECCTIKKHIAEITKMIEETILVKKEILFLPYQVSMWDSLESIWMAAKEDPETECYVVPLPVYDVNMDNSLGNMCYEGDKYPAYVPITSYMDYDIEQRKPDIIYFHNPYDETNLVTRVPEKYYSRNIKNHTRILVYIPYFISEGNGPADHQCYTMGVLFADRVIVQSGNIYKKYSRIYSNFLKENKLQNILVPAESKFIPMGSPKIDKLVSTKCEIEHLPKSWQKIILKPDGTRKKIILYNLTIELLLQNNLKMLKKLEDVLCKFKMRQEEVVLIWRPHPLLVKTINAMRPQLRDAYMQIVQQYKDEGWGIFDETPDPNLAMMLSDAYYGDFSSLVTAYRVLKKPMLLQNIDEIYVKRSDKKEKMALWFIGSSIMLQDELWFAANGLNGLYKFQMDGNGAVLESRFVEEEDYQEDLYRDIVQWEDKLVFVPSNAKKLAVYDIKRKSTKYYELPEEIENIEGSKYRYGFIYHQCVFFIGTYSNLDILKFDLSTEKFELCGCIPDHVLGIDHREVLGHSDRSDSLLLIPLAEKNSILIYDMDSGSHNIAEVDSDITEKISGIYCSAQKIFVNFENKIYEWDVKKNVFSILTELPVRQLRAVMADQRYIYAFDNENPDIYLFDMICNTLNKIDAKYDKWGKAIGLPCIIPIHLENRRLVCLSLYSNEILVVDHDKIVGRYQLYTDDTNINRHQLYTTRLKKEGKFYKSGLDDFIEYIINEDDSNMNAVKSTVGKEIYHAIMRQLI